MVRWGLLDRTGFVQCARHGPADGCEGHRPLFCSLSLALSMDCHTKSVGFIDQKCHILQTSDPQPLWLVQSKACSMCRSMWTMLLFIANAMLPAVPASAGGIYTCKSYTLGARYGQEGCMAVAGLATAGLAAPNAEAAPVHGARHAVVPQQSSLLVIIYHSNSTHLHGSFSLKRGAVGASLVLLLVVLCLQHCPAKQHDVQTCPICSWAGVPGSSGGSKKAATPKRKAMDAATAAAAAAAAAAVAAEALETGAGAAAVVVSECVVDAAVTKAPRRRRRL